MRRGSGGVAIYWRNSLSGVSPLLNIKHDRVCGIRLQTSNGTVVHILSVYMPTPGSSDDLGQILDELAGIVENLDEGSINIITGDFNGDLGSSGGPRSGRQITRAGRKVLNFMKNNSYTAVNLSYMARGAVDTFSCHNGSSTIDYALIPSAYIRNVSSCYVDSDNALNTSDHYPVRTVIDIGEMHGYIECRQERKTLRWDKVDPHLMYETYGRPLYNILSDLPDIDLKDTPSKRDIDMIFERTVQGIHLAAEAIPRSKYVRHLKPFWSDELTELKRIKMYWFNLSLSTFA